MTARGRMFNRKRPTQVAHDIATSLIAHGTRITGDVNFKGSLFLEGEIDGQVTAIEPGALLTVGEQGLVQGDIRVPAAIIHGSVCGDVYTMERLELAATARVAGNVCYGSIVVIAGAQIDGRLQHGAWSCEDGIAPLTLPTSVIAVAVPEITGGFEEADEASSTTSLDHASDSAVHGSGLEPLSDRRSRKRNRHGAGKQDA